MTNKEFAKQLERRTRQFAVQVLRLSSRLSNGPEVSVVRNQLAKSGTSVGANYREANRSRSKADFISRIKICESEASETEYWLQVVVEADLLAWDVVKPVYEECGELLALFTSIATNVKKARSGT